jgi:hypothetical protein
MTSSWAVPHPAPITAPLASDPGIAAFGALTAVTLISLGLGYGLRKLLPPSVVPWLAAALFLVFGLFALRQALG